MDGYKAKNTTNVTNTGSGNFAGTENRNVKMKGSMNSLYENLEDIQEFLKEEYEKYGYGYKCTCTWCGKVFYSRLPNAKKCSYRCTNDAKIANRKQRKELEREKMCPICGNEFHAKRKDSIYCSKKCKQKVYRQNRQCVMASGSAVFGGT